MLRGGSVWRFCDGTPEVLVDSEASRSLTVREDPLDEFMIVPCSSASVLVLNYLLRNHTSDIGPQIRGTATIFALGVGQSRKSVVQRQKCSSMYDNAVVDIVDFERQVTICKNKL